MKNLMKTIILAGSLAGLTATALADSPPPPPSALPAASCIDPHKSYVARPLNLHDIFVQTTLGKPKPPVRLKTTCIHLDPVAGIGLSTAFNCLGQGDIIVATLVGGHRESCRITRVLPYAPEQGDLPQKP